MDPSQLGELVGQHKWVAVAAIVIGLLVRVVKSDIKIPINIPPAARPWLALGLGLLSGVLEKAATGRTWTSAIVDGVVSAVIAMVAHDAVIGGLRGGKEIPVPGLMIPGAAPGPAKPVTVPPAPLQDPDQTPTPIVPPRDD